MFHKQYKIKSLYILYKYRQHITELMTLEKIFNYT